MPNDFFHWRTYNRTLKAYCICWILLFVPGIVTFIFGAAILQKFEEDEQNWKLYTNEMECTLIADGYTFNEQCNTFIEGYNYELIYKPDCSHFVSADTSINETLFDLLASDRYFDDYQLFRFVEQECIAKQTATTIRSSIPRTEICWVSYDCNQYTFYDYNAFDLDMMEQRGMILFLIGIVLVGICCCWGLIECLMDAENCFDCLFTWTLGVAITVIFGSDD